MNKSKKIIIYIITLVLSAFIINTQIQLDVQAGSVPTIKFDKDGNVSGTIKELDDRKTILNDLLGEYRVVITFLSGIGSLAMISFFIMNFIALGNSKGNPQSRQKAIAGLIVSGIATAGLGSVTLITGLFYNMLAL